MEYSRVERAEGGNFIDTINHCGIFHVFKNTNAQNRMEQKEHEICPVFFPGSRTGNRCRSIYCHVVWHEISDGKTIPVLHRNCNSGVHNRRHTFRRISGYHRRTKFLR